MIDRLLRFHLIPIAERQRRLWLARDLSLCWGLAALVGFGLVLLLGLSGWPLSLLVSLLGLATVTVALKIWRRHRGWEPDFRAVARQIEEQHPELHALLLTAVEQQPEAGERFNFLQERVIREALAECRRQGNDWVETVPARHLVVAQGAHVATLALFGMAIAWGFSSSSNVKRFAPLIRLVGGVSVTPGDTSLERGSSLVVLARFEGRLPSAATLVVTPLNQNEQRIPLTKNLDDPVFGGSVPEVSTDLGYRIEYVGTQTRNYRVTVFDYPKLERADATIHYPEYTGLPEKKIEDTRRVSAVEGSTLDYLFRLNKPVTSAALVAKDKTTLALTPDTERPNVYRASFVLDQSQRYDLLLTDDAGRTNKSPPQFFVDVLKNRPPELKFAYPRGDQRVSALEEIAFQAETVDDFGLRAYGLTYQLAGQEAKEINLGSPSAANEKRQFNHLLPLEQLGVAPEQLVSWYIWADDVGPDGQVRRTAGDMFFAEVRPFEEIFREGSGGESDAQSGSQQQQGSRGGNESMRVADLQKQIINATWKVQRQVTGVAKTPPKR